MADKLEALAFGAAAAYTRAGGSKLLSLNEYGKCCWRAAVESVLRELGSVNSKGEVVAPVPGAVGMALGALNAAERVAEHEDRCQECEDGFECDRGDALRVAASDRRAEASRALRRGGGEE